LDNKILIEQSQHWEKSFSSKPEMFGSDPSIAAIKSLKYFKDKNYLQGRLFFFQPIFSLFPKNPSEILEHL